MAAKVTPMMRQYRRIKGELPEDVILLFRLGEGFRPERFEAGTSA